MKTTITKSPQGDRNLMRTNEQIKTNKKKNRMTKILTSLKGYIPQKHKDFTEIAHGTGEVIITTEHGPIPVSFSFQQFSTYGNSQRANDEICDHYCTYGWNDILIIFNRSVLKKYLRNMKLGHNSINMDLLIHKAKEQFDYQYVIKQHARQADHICYMMNNGERHTFTTIDTIEEERFFENKGLNLTELKQDYSHLDFVRIPDFLKHLPCEKNTLDMSDDLSIYTFPEGSQFIANAYRKYTYREYFRITSTKYTRSKTRYQKHKKQKSTLVKTRENEMLSVRSMLLKLLDSSTVETLTDCIRFCPTAVKKLSEEIEEHLAETGHYLITKSKRDEFNLALKGGRRTVRFEGDLECW